MPMLHIGAVTSDNLTLSVGLALMGVVQEKFSESYHVLCSWHVNQNFRANTKKFCPKPEKDEEFHQMHEEFYEAWIHIIASPTKLFYRARLAVFQIAAFPTPAIKDTWLVLEEKLVACWVDEIPHFRNKTASRLEPLVKTVFDWPILFWSNQRENILIKQMNHQRSRKILAQKDLFLKIKDHVYGNCLEHLWAECSKLRRDDSRPEIPCTGLVKSSMGIPCSHDLWLPRESGRLYIQRNMLHSHWFIERPEPGHIFPDDDTSVIMDPNDTIDKRRAIKKARHGGRKRGIRQANRKLSTFEHQIIVSPDAQNQLAWENIAANHRQERILMMENTIKTIPTPSSVAPLNYPFSSSSSSPYPSIVATQAPIYSSLVPTQAPQN
ncbi:hypothetical protein OnM2_025091 [Erysiphe neolycopersici]|uniref:MULE transposase domain-containing protein n=1 Tax=Erysiphe neolycopersici TaxID=212602 RepID=A0A420I1E9_9PEZI|nr:hypothetical protein OnM2_025091 [Erysiphe neolycopersici]